MVSKMSDKSKYLTETANYFPGINAAIVSSLLFTSKLFLETARQVQIRNCTGFQERLYVTNVSMFNTGMAFELLFKVFYWIDKKKPAPRTHEFKRLYNALNSDTCADIEICIKKSGWLSVKEFLDHLDNNIRHGDRRYYEIHSMWDAFWIAGDRHCFLELESLYGRLFELAKGRIWKNPNLPMS